MEDHRDASVGAVHSQKQQIKRRRRTTKHELAVLEALFEESRNPSYQARLEACRKTQFDLKALNVWLQNRRQKEKKQVGIWKPSYSSTGECASGSVNPSSSHSSFSGASSSSTRSVSPHESIILNNTTLHLPPIITDTSKQSSPHLKQSIITLPPISTVMATESFSSRDPLSSRLSNNKLSPMLTQQDENRFTANSTTVFSSRPMLGRAASTESVHSATTCSSSIITSRAEDLNNRTAHTSKPTNASSSTAPKPHPTFRRTSSQYSLSIANDGKAQMRVTELPVQPNEHAHAKQHTKPVLPSLATAILAPISPSSHSARPSLLSFPHSTIQHSISRQPISLASAPLSNPKNNSSLPFSSLSIVKPGRVLSLPSLSTFSSKASIKSESSSDSIFAGGLRQGSPPKKPTAGFSSHLSNQRHYQASQRQLWDNLESDPVEPEDEAIANHNKRLMDSPVRRISVRMEDVLSSSRKKRKAAADPDHDMSASVKATAVFGHRSMVNPRDFQPVASSTPAKRQCLTDIKQCGSAKDNSVALAPGQINSTRGRGYSKSMLSRSMSLDRAILQDDSTDEEYSPMKRGPASAGLYQSSGFLGRPPLARASTHVGVKHIDTADPRNTVKKVLLKADGKLAAAEKGQEEENDASGDDEEQMAHRSSEVAHLTTSPTSLDTSAEEPDLTFSTEASQQSFDMSEAATLSELQSAPQTSAHSLPLNTHSGNMTKQQPAIITFSTPSKAGRAAGAALAVAARHGHMSSPIKMGSPTKNGKILTEVERDCAAVLVGLGFPDV
ncbi:hypothetical protein P389DRAFT_19754 [Cystobasidium minutum MCA 4210]|uniref:uncharacterized protein n=1 Tax=Cystobasidium minutum MCA 4210 TaxID=1397322 RepID=UPI0034CF5AE4|eukprot:jgi/Rhomi1/19754/CE19753_760